VLPNPSSRSLAAALVSVAGLALTLAACGSTASNPSAANDQPVNTGLRALSDPKSAPPTLMPGEALPKADPATAQQIAQSARLLDDYFAELAKRNGQSFQAGAGAYDPSASTGPASGAPQAAAAPRPVATIDPAGVSSGLNALAADTPRTLPTPPVTPPTATAAASNSGPGPSLASAAPTPPPASEWDALNPGELDVDTSIGLSSVTGRRSATTPSQPAPAAAQPTPSTSVTALAPAPEGANATFQMTAAVPVVANRPPTPATPDQRKQELVSELVGILKELAKTSDEPYRAGLALAGLETLSPGALYDLTSSGMLMPHETEVLLAAHQLFEGLSAGGGTMDAGRAMDIVEGVQDRLNQTAPLKISAAELCTRVSGFGQYATFPKNADGSFTFQAGRRQPVIIYVEVDRFGRKPVVEDGVTKWDVTLSQELQIFQVSDNLLVTSRAAETDRTVARSKMRDYYLINQTFLPETLATGRYALKVIMRDAHKNAVAESIIPFQIVAQPTLGQAGE
jgi:hypothetical protein